MNTVTPLPSRIGSSTLTPISTQTQTQRVARNTNTNTNATTKSKMAEAPPVMSQDSASDHAATTPPAASLLVCPICRGQLSNPHMLPCLHVFCLQCLRDECEGKSTGKFFCPLCVEVASDTGEKDACGNGGSGKKSYHSRVWHSFERVLEQENGSEEELQRRHRRAELPSRKDDINNDGDEGDEKRKSREESQWEEGEDKNEGDEESPDSNNSRKSSSSSLLLEPPMLFPCSMHADRVADTFCQKCDQLACHKCVSSFHRRCQNFSGLKEAVDAKRNQFDSIHDKMAANLVACEDVVDFQQKRLQEIEAARTEILVQIKKFRTDIVNAVLAKEKALTQEANQILDELKSEATDKNEAAGKLAVSLQRQMELLDLSFSVKGEAELLPILPGIPTRIDKDAKTIMHQFSDAFPKVTFVPDEDCKTALDVSLLGRIQVTADISLDNANSSLVKTMGGGDPTDSRPDLNLALVTSFHGGTREDFTEPLLTDLIVIANGDIILTDRDNRCVKKFTQTGKLLTRVILDAVPSRITTVSHARAAVSVMNKKLLYFLSLFGTVRVLSTVRVKKFYSFLTSLGGGLLAAGTNLCESIDIINERGETIRSVFTQKSDKAAISRPLYLTPVVPRSSIILSTTTNGSSSNNSTLPQQSAMTNNNTITNTTATTNNNGNSVNNNVYNDSSISSSSRRSSLKTYNNNSNDINNQQTITSKTLSPSSFSTTSSSTSKKSSKVKYPKKNSLSTSPSSMDKNHTHHPPSSSSPSSSSSSSNSDQDILVSDSGKRVLFRIQQRMGGSVALNLGNNSEQVRLECPLGITVHEGGLTLLADRDSDCVLLLDTDGNLLKRVLGPGNGLCKPCGIYAGLKGSVTLSQVDGTVRIYKAV